VTRSRSHGGPDAGSVRGLADPACDDQARILTALKSRMPYALQQLPLDGVVALGKAPGPGRCHWCAALLVRGLDQPELPGDEINLALLGNGCADCRQRWTVTDRATELVAAVQERERLTDELCRGRPWLAAALVASANGPHSLDHQLDRDCWRMGAYRAGLNWGINPGIFTGDRAAIHEVVRHPVWGPALTRRYDDD
jgi:hypothetical protein